MMRSEKLINYIRNDEFDDGSEIDSEVNFYVDESYRTVEIPPCDINEQFKKGMKNEPKNISITNHEKKVLDELSLYEKKFGWLMKQSYALRYIESDEGRGMFMNRQKHKMTNGSNSKELSENDDVIHNITTNIYIDLPEDCFVLAIEPAVISNDGVNTIPTLVQSSEYIQTPTIFLQPNQNEVDSLNENILHDGTPIAQLLPIKKQEIKCDAVVKTHSDEHDE